MHMDWIMLSDDNKGNTVIQRDWIMLRLDNACIVVWIFWLILVPFFLTLYSWIMLTLDNACIVVWTFWLISVVLSF